MFRKRKLFQKDQVYGTSLPEDLVNSQAAALKNLDEVIEEARVIQRVRLKWLTRRI